MLVLAVLFPIGLMVFNPTLMFERGWEQYVGTAIYFWAVLTLGRELLAALAEREGLRGRPQAAPVHRRDAQAARARQRGRCSSALAAAIGDDGRILPVRVRQLVGYVRETHAPSAAQLMEVNREASGLDQEHMAGRFTLTRYILYLLPVIGFIGTVEGISKALMNISKVLPLVKDLDAFLNNLTGVTSALQIAFDSTLLALFLSAALMLVQTLVFRKSEELLARVDGWVVEHVLPGVGHARPDGRPARRGDRAPPGAAPLRAGDACSPRRPGRSRSRPRRSARACKAPIAQLAASMDRLPSSMAAFQQGATAIGRVGNELEVLETAGDAMRRGAATLSRIETALTQSARADPQLEEIKRGLDRATLAIESLSSSWASAYEKSSRTTQEQLARTHEQPEGRAGADQREHRAGQLAVPQHRQEDVRRAVGRHAATVDSVRAA